MFRWGLSRIHLRICTVVTLLVFSINSFAVAQFPIGLKKPSNLRSALTLPQTLGMIREQESGFFPLSPSHPFVIHIQDAHANDKAQKNIAQILELLALGQKIDLVFVEGARGPLDAKYLKFSEDPALNQKIADRLTRLGELTAADLYLFKNGNALEFMGIEDPKLYRENVRVMKNVILKEKESREWIGEQESLLDRDITRLANKDLLELLRMVLHEDQETRSLLRDISTLDRLSRKRLRRDLRDPSQQREFPNLIRLLRLKDDEKSIDLEEVKKEVRMIPELVQFVADQAGLNSPLKRGASEGGGVCERSDTPRSLRDHPSREGIHGASNPRFILENLYPLLKRRGFDFREFPQFSRYARNRIFQYELRSDELFEEIRRWMDLLLAELVKTNEEKNLQSG